LKTKKGISLFLSKNDVILWQNLAALTFMYEITLI